MRLPRLRIPQLRLPLAGLGGFGGRRALLYIGYTTLLFVVFLLRTFPYDPLIKRLLSSVNSGAVVVEYKEPSFAWLKGLEISNLRVVSTNTEDGHPPFLECGHFWVRPAFGALVRGNPYAVQVRADLYGGAALGEIRYTAGNLVGNLQWQDVELGRYRTLTSLLDEGQVAGRVSGQFDFEARGTNLNSGQGNGEVTIDAASLTVAKISGFTVPDLHLRQTKVKFTIHSGRLEVQEFNAAGDVSVQGSGQVVVRDPLQESVLNLRATLLPTPTTPDALKALLALIPRAPGAKPDAPVTVTGTLARPRFR